MKIGVFDSGVGGITVLKELLKILPKEDYIYYADVLHVPYGTKSKEEVKKYVFEAVEFMVSKGIEALIIACNTATSISVSELRKKYDFPIIGMEPAVKPAVEKCNNKKVLVTATPLTLKEDKFHNLVTRLESEDIVEPLPLPGLVEYAEKYIFNEEEIIGYLKDKLSPYNLDEYGAIVLGCTHFPYYREYFKKIVPSHIDIIDGNKGTVNHLKNILLEKKAKLNSGSGEIKFFLSGQEDNIKLKKYLDLL